MNFNNFKDLEEYLKNKINTSLIKDVAPVIKQCVKDEVENTVYSVYSPKQYVRRYLRGGNGLNDLENIKSELTSDGELCIRDIAKPDSIPNEYLDEMIVYGYGDRDEIWNSPRDFYIATVENLKQSQEHIKALKRGLNK